MGLKVKILTGRTLKQGVAKEGGKTTDRYVQAVGICEMHPQDLASLNIKDGDPVKISTAYDSVVLKSTTATREVGNQGVVFIPYGPYASILFGSGTDSSGMPTFKGIDGEIEPAPGETVLTLKQILEKYYGR